VGKVVLEKILRSIPEVKKIYVLIRPKSGVSVTERMKRQIFQSACFDNIRKIYGEGYNKFIDTKVEAIEGDISDHKYI